MRKNLFFSIWLLLSLCTVAVSFSSYDKEDDKKGSNTKNDKDNSGTSGESVLINGVRWATCNVDAPGTFAASPESPGMFYQWNRKKAWPATGSVTGWDNSNPTSDSWEKANDPSPAGYRVPTLDEIKTLLDKNKVTNEWTTQNGVIGRRFTDIATGNSIFLPAVGYRGDDTGTLDLDGTSGLYWSSSATEDDEHYACSLAFLSYFADWINYFRYNGLSVRPVAE